MTEEVLIRIADWLFHGSGVTRGGSSIQRGSRVRLE